MKGKLAALIAGIVLGGTGAGLAATNFTSLGSAYGIKCLKDASAKAIYCGKLGGSGYVVGISTYAVVVNNQSGHSVLKRFQP